MKKLIISIVLILGALISKAPNLSLTQLKERETFVEDLIKQEEINRELVGISNSNFTPKLLKRYLELKQVKDINIIIAQFRLETGHFKSKSFLIGNNISGMKKPRKRPNLASGELYGHAKFNSWVDSVEDYLLWQKYNRNKLKDSENYYAFLAKVGYAEDSNYIKIIKNIKIT